MTEYTYFKSTLEIHKQNDEYVVKDMIKGELFHSSSGDECVKYLFDNCQGQTLITYCDFITESYGMAKGSEHNPRIVNWHTQ